MSKKIIYAVHDQELETLLKNLELYDDFFEGNIRCFICDKIITEENLGSIFPYEEDIKICCNDIDCYKKLLELRGNSNE
jgi:hypothetical protein